MDDIDIKIYYFAQGSYYDETLEYYYGFHNADFIKRGLSNRPNNYPHDIPRQIYAGNSMLKFLGHYALDRFDYYVLPARYVFTREEQAHFAKHAIRLTAKVVWKGQEVSVIYSPYSDSLIEELEVETYSKKFDWEIATKIDSLVKSRFIALSFLWGGPYYPPH